MDLHERSSSSEARAVDQQQHGGCWEGTVGIYSKHFFYTVESVQIAQMDAGIRS